MSRILKFTFVKNPRTAVSRLDLPMSLTSKYLVYWSFKLPVFGRKNHDSPQCNQYDLENKSFTRMWKKRFYKQCFIINKIFTEVVLKKLLFTLISSKKLMRLVADFTVDYGFFIAVRQIHVKHSGTKAFSRFCQVIDHVRPQSKSNHRHCLSLLLFFSDSLVCSEQRKDWLVLNQQLGNILRATIR